MARRRKDEQYNGAKNGSWGVSEKALAALESGNYKGRKAQYRTSEEQTRQSQDFPALDGMLDSDASKKIWESNFGRSRRQNVDTNRARRSYEQRMAHNAPDFRDLRNNGFNASYNSIDFSGLSDFDKELLDAELYNRDNNLERRTDAEKIANAQSYIDKYGKSRNEVLDAYQMYKAAQEREARETTPFKAGFKDFKSAPDRGLANAVKYLGENFLPDSDIEKFGDWLQEKTGVKEVEKQRNYSRESDKIGDFKKAMLDPYFQYGDLASSELASALLSGFAMGDPAAGFGMSFEGNPLLKGAMKYGTGYGLTADEKYNQLVRQGVDEDEAAQRANIAGLGMVAAQAAGRAVPTLGAGTSLAQRLLTKGGIGGTIMAGRQGLEEIADALIGENQGEYNQSVQKHIAEGMSPKKADLAAKAELYSRLGGSYLFGLLTGAGTELAENGLSKAASKAADNVDDTLNSVWATQPALEDKGVPRLTGTVDNTQALPGNGQLPALVDNIYPIQMPGTNGVINLPGETAPIMLPDLAAQSAPVANKVMNESAGWTNPRLIKKLEGAELAEAQAQIKSNNNKIEALKTEIEVLKNDPKNMYRGNLKKAVQKDIYNREKQMRELQSANKGLDQQVKGGLKPVLDMLSKEQKNLIYDTSGKYDSVFSQINFAAKFAGDTPEAKALATKAQNAIRQYVKTGSSKSLKDMTTALTELDNMAKTVNAIWKSSKGNEWNYEKAFGDQAQYLYNLQPVADIYNAEKAAARAAQNVPQTAGESAPIEAPVQYPTPQGDTSYIPQTHAGTSEPLAQDLFVKRYTTKDSKDTGKSRGLFVSNESTPSPHQDMGDDLRHYAIKAGAKVYDTAFNGKLQTSRYDSPVQVSTNVNYLVDKWGENTVQNLLDMPRNELIQSLDEDLGGVFDKGKDNLEILENVGAYIAKRDGIDVLRTVDKDFNESQGVLASPEDFTEMAVLNDSVLQRVGEANNGTGTSAPTPLENPPQTVNTVPEVTNEPNFSMVGEPYTPQEVPNVQNTPPTTPPPAQEVPNMDGNMKTSQYYKNTMRGTETNRDMSDEEYANRFDEELFKRMTIPEQQSVSMGQRFIEESGGKEAAIQRLLSGDFDSEERFSGFHIDAAEMLANDIERQALDLEAQGQDASALWRTANKLHKKIQQNASEFGVGMQALQKWKKSTPQGAFDDLVGQINKGIDNKKTTGYTRTVNNLSEKIVDAVENSDDKTSLISKIKEIFAKDRESNSYDTKKAEQLVLDLVGGDKNTKMSITDLADEAGKVIKKQMGVSSLTPKEERAVLNLLDAASKLEPGTRAYNELVSQAMVIVDESLPSSMGDKFKSLLYDNMLASIKTMFTRNLGGNVVGNTIDALAAPFQVGADAIVGKFTGARTRSLTGKSIIEAAKGFGHGFKDWGQDIAYSAKNKTAFNTPRSGQESLADVLQAVHKTWKTQSNNKAVKAVTNALSAYDYIIRKGMEGGDRPIYEAQYAATKAELYDVIDKYGDKGLRMGLPKDKQDIDTDDLVEAIAINDALEAVLQNDSKMKEAAKNLKAFFKKSSEDMLGIDVASMSHAPFVEVPANMASNFFKLTPIGWAGNIARTVGEKKKYGSINQRRFTGELGLNVLGGLMLGAGVAAAGKYISGPYSEKKEERKLQQNNGYQEYALQTPDESTQIDISDIPYLGPMMKFAKMERDAYNEGGLSNAVSAIPSSASAATVDQLYQALNRLTGADFQYNGNGNLIQNAVNNIKSSVGSMGVPSAVRQTAQYLDDYKRDLGDYGTDEYNKNLIINGIPILREKMLEPKIDTAGQPVPELGGATGINRLLSAYVSPWKVSHPHANTSAVQEYANMLKQATEGQVNPQMKVITKSDLTGIKGYDKENYSHADLRKLQEDYYKSNTELGNALINDPWFTNLSYEKQGELLDELWSANKALAKEKIVREGLTPEQIEAKGDELYTTDDKLAGVIRDDDENHTGLLKWLHDENSRDEMNAKYGTEMSHDKYVDYNSREEGYAEQRASETEKAKALGMSVDSYEKYENEYEGGAQAYADDKANAIKYGFVNSNKVANVDAYNIAKNLGNGDPNVIQAYSDYKQEGIKSNAYAAKASYLMDEDRLTDEQKGMIIAGSTDGTKIGKLAKGAQGAYDIGGYAGVNYYYLLKNEADEDGSGTVSKDERKNFFAGDSQELDNLWQLNQDMYNYLMNNLK